MPTETHSGTKDTRGATDATDAKEEKAPKQNAQTLLLCMVRAVKGSQIARTRDAVWYRVPNSFWMRVDPKGKEFCAYA